MPPPQRSLEQLYRDFLATGEDAALEQLFRRSGPALRRLARRLGAGAEDAEDLVQETLVAAIQGADRFDPQRPLLPWLKGILTFRAAKLARDEVRRRRHYTIDGDALDDAAGPDPTPPAELAGRELTEDVGRAIASLPPHYQAPLQQFLLAERSPVQIAADLGLGRATVRVRLHRGLRQLRARLLRWTGALLALLVVRPARAASHAPRWPFAGVALALAVVVPLALRRATTPQPAEVPQTADAAAAVATDASRTPPPMREPARMAVAGEAPATASTPADALADLTVQVRDAAGRALPHTGVLLQPQSGRDPVLHRRLAVSDADGVVVWHGLVPGTFHIACDRGPTADCELLRGANATVLSVPDGQTVTGRVVDGDGRPIAGAAIWLGIGEGPWRGTDMATSGDDGTFTLANLPDRACLAARHARFAGSEPVAIDTSVATGEVIELRLGALGGSVAVLAQDELGHPLADAQVFVGEAADATPLWLADGALPWRAPPWEGRTDAQGHLVTGALAPGRHPVIVRTAGRAPHRGQIEITAGERASYRAQLFAGATVRGIVVDDTGAAVPGAEVVFRTADPAASIDVRADAAGAFAFEGLALAAADLASRATGHLPAVAVAVLDRPGELALTLRLPRARTLHGHVQRGAQTPIAGSSVRATWPPSALSPEPQMATVGLGGDFALTEAPPGTPKLEIRLAGEPLWRPLAAFAAWTGDAVAVTLPEGFAADAWLAGSLQCADGSALAGSRLFVCRDGVQWAEIGRSDGDGAFRLGPLPAGDYDLFAETTSPLLPTVPVGRFSLAAGEQRSIVHTAAAAGAVDLQLTRGDGAPLGDVVVTFVGTAIERRFALATTTRVRQALLPGDYLVYVMGSHIVWREAVPVHVTAGVTTTLPLVLAAGSRATIVPQGLPPAPGLRRITLTMPDLATAPPRVFSLPADAPLRLGAMLAAGRYELALDEGGRHWRGVFTVPDDAAAALFVQMAPR